MPIFGYLLGNLNDLLDMIFGMAQVRLTLSEQAFPPYIWVFGRLAHIVEKSVNLTLRVSEPCQNVFHIARELAQRLYFVNLGGLNAHNL